MSRIAGRFFTIWATREPGGQKEKEFIHHMSCPIDLVCQALYISGLHLWMCCQNDLHDAHAAVAGKSQGKKLETYARSTRQGPFRMHVSKLSKHQRSHCGGSRSWSVRKRWPRRRAAITTGPGFQLVCGTAVCLAGYLAASLASTYREPAHEIPPMTRSWGEDLTSRADQDLRDSEKLPRRSP